MEVTVAFPTEIWVGTLEGIDNRSIEDEILYREKVEKSEIKSNKGGWQSLDNFHHDESFSSIWGLVYKEFDLLCLHNNYKDLKIEVINAWANVNRFKDFNISHYHDRSNWSCVYYVTVPDDSGKIVFIDPRISRSMVTENNLVRNYDNLSQSSEYYVHPLEGRFIIFPSWLVHYVEPNQSDSPRVSISFNVSLNEYT